MKKIVVNGTFDVIHPGHLALLNYAKSLGDFLVVLLENLRAVDQVIIFNSSEELIDIIRSCSIMVKGSDYKGKSVIGVANCEQVIYFERLDEYSSTKKIQSIIDR